MYGKQAGGWSKTIIHAIPFVMDFLLATTGQNLCVKCVSIFSSKPQQTGGFFNEWQTALFAALGVKTSMSPECRKTAIAS